MQNTEKYFKYVFQIHVVKILPSSDYNILSITYI